MSAALGTADRGPQSGAGAAVFLTGRRKDVQNDTALAERPSSVWHIRRRLPEITCFDRILARVMNPDPLAFKAHASLLVRM